MNRFFVLSKGLSLLMFLIVGPIGFADSPVGGFADISYTATDNGSAKDGNSFGQGGIDFYYTKRLDKKTTFLAEIVYEFDDQNAAVLDPERIWVQYYHNKWLKVKAGRVHTALGYWNDAYHHGNWLQTTVGRPKIYSFEDEEGILPVHAVGLEFRGEGRLGSGDLGYIINIANGRGKTVDPPQVVGDADGQKAVNALIYYTMPKLSDLRVGMTVYSDSMPGDDSSGTLKNKGSESLYGAHLVWQPGKAQILAEYLTVAHSYDTGEADATIAGGYAQMSYRFGKTTPYARYDFVTADTVKDSYTGIEKDYTGLAIGARYDLSLLTAVKLELTETEKKGEEKVKSATLNWSYAW